MVGLSNSQFRKLKEAVHALHYHHVDRTKTDRRSRKTNAALFQTLLDGVQVGLAVAAFNAAEVCYNGVPGVDEDLAKAMDLYVRAFETATASEQDAVLRQPSTLTNNVLNLIENVMLPALPETLVVRLESARKTNPVYASDSDFCCQLDLVRYNLRARRHYLLSERKAAAKLYQKASKVAVKDPFLQGYCLKARRIVDMMQNTEDGGGEEGMKKIDAAYAIDFQKNDAAAANHPDAATFEGEQKRSADFCFRHYTASFNGENEDQAMEAVRELAKESGVDEANILFSEGRQVRRVCAACGKGYLQISGLKECARCKKACYCDASCQRAHWKEHKKQCRAPA